MSIPGFLKKKRTWIALVVVILLIGGFLFMQGQGQQRQAELEAATASAPESPYAAIANGRADVEGGVIQVAARRGGVVREVYVNEGDEVTAGQILARQEDDEPRLAVQRASAEVAQARSQLAAIEVDLNTARREFERMNRLADSNFIAAQRLDQARDAIAMAEATINRVIATGSLRIISQANSAENSTSSVPSTATDRTVVYRSA